MDTLKKKQQINNPDQALQKTTGCLTAEIYKTHQKYQRQTH